MGKDLGMDEADYAIMLNIYDNVCGQVLSGKLYDMIGTRLGFTVSIILWSVASIFIPSPGLFSLTLLEGF
jgi:ACS family hexuronate transporter-like MFS transporter